MVEHDVNPRLVYTVSTRLLAEMWKHIQVGLTDGRDDTNIEKQGNGHICVHWPEKGDFTLIMSGRIDGRGKREEACMNMLLDSGTWRRTATRLRVNLASSRDVEPSDRTSVSNKRRTESKNISAGFAGAGRTAAHSWEWSWDQCAQSSRRRSRTF